MSDPRLEEVARALYVASGGDVAVFPWPCRGADRYRTLASAAIEAYTRPSVRPVSVGWVSEDAAKPVTL